MWAGAPGESAWGGGCSGVGNGSSLKCVFISLQWWGERRGSHICNFVVFVNAPFLSLPPFLCFPSSSSLSPSLFPPHLRARCWCFSLSFRREDKLVGGGRDFLTCKGTDNPRASPPRAIAPASYPKATSRSPLTPAPSGLPKMLSFEPWRPPSPHP